MANQSKSIPKMKESKDELVSKIKKFKDEKINLKKEGSDLKKILANSGIAILVVLLIVIGVITLQFYTGPETLGNKVPVTFWTWGVAVVIVALIIILYIFRKKDKK